MSEGLLPSTVGNERRTNVASAKPINLLLQNSSKIGADNGVILLDISQTIHEKTGALAQRDQNDFRARRFASNPTSDLSERKLIFASLALALS